MTPSFPFALKASGTLLRVLILLNLVLGALILGLLAASLAAPAPVMEALGVRSAEGRSLVILGMRLIMVVGLLSVPLAHIALTRLRAMVETVRRGDPFLRDNAARLQTIAWALLGLELLHLVAGAVAAGASSAANPLDIDWSFSVTGWLAVLLLFVLARVFDHGARMREDLEGTI
ncbi:MAG: hypothetical protein QOG72_1765 [Sphingomonadales bacterium]|jgi:hypothetical protein|nr:hypothetical protein [Sphingomonadales bacterium]